MKKLFLIISAMSFCLAGNAQAYVVDGSVSDWGIDLFAPGAASVNYLNTHTPNSPVQFFTEDNASNATPGNVFVGPGWSTGNLYDAETIYFDNDATNAYIAIITGLPQFGATYPPGDIFLDTGKYQDPSSPTYNPNKYEYGIDIATSKLYSVDLWENVVFFPEANPWAIGSGTFLADVPFVYSGLQNTHYVLEASLPISYLNIEDDDPLWLHWTMHCGNDIVNLRATASVTTPEPASAALFASGLSFAFARLRRRR